MLKSYKVMILYGFVFKEKENYMENKFGSETMEWNH